MCGIAGILNFKKIVTQEEIEKITNSLLHRGPDDYGTQILFNGKLALGHRRLKILDLSEKGRQPMSYLNNRYHITFNGEIFNYLEIKSNLKNYGYKFKSETDTEVILAAFDKWKENCFLRFNGMWSIAIWDDKLKKLILSRDRFGEKPLYFRYQNEKLSFASEIKSFVKLEDFRRSEFNFEILKNYQNLEGNENNIIKTVKTLEPGSNLTLFSNGTLSIKKWWDLNNHIEKLNLNYNQKIERFEELFTDACKIRLRSDRKIATSLSGGLDSTGLLATLKKIDNNFLDIPSFSLVFNNSIYDESNHIKTLEKFFSNKIKKINFEDINFSVNDLKNVILSNENLEEPHIGPWLIYREMKRNNYVVSLDGHGPDELLGGYYDHFKYAIKDENDLEKKNSLLKLRKEIFPNSSFKNDIKFKEDRKLSADALIRLLKNLFKKKNKIEEINYKFKNLNTLFNKKLFYDFNFFSLPKILNNFDKLSMVHGVEVRSPYLDWRLVSFCFSLTQNDKITEKNNKIILRDYIKKITDKKLNIRRDKIGFVTPPNFFKGNKIEEFLNDTATSKEFKTSNFFDGYKISENFLLQNKNYYNINSWSQFPFWKYFQTHILFNSLKND